MKTEDEIEELLAKNMHYHQPSFIAGFKKGKESQLQALKEGLGERLEEIAMKHKLSEGKPEGANGYGEAFWCGRERELQEVLNIINKYSQT